MPVTVTGVMRVKNEARWIAQVIASMMNLCERVLVLDDHSSDGTPDMCRGITGVTVFDSPFHGLDEARDKNWLLYKAEQAGAEWLAMIDGDEVLEPGASEIIRRDIASGRASAYSLKILYLWNSPTTYRVDGVYGRFERPSVFQCIHGLRFAPTGHGANFHCGSVPRGHTVMPSDARLLHLGYLLREDRLRKYRWYNEVDQNSRTEDGYRHIVQGDIPDVPADARLMYAGPLRLESLI